MGVGRSDFLFLNMKYLHWFKIEILKGQNGNRLLASSECCFPASQFSKATGVRNFSGDFQEPLMPIQTHYTYSAFEALIMFAQRPV